MSDDSLIGQQLDEYRLDTLLGQGGMARVYRGLDVRLKRWVAIKVIDAPFRTDSDYVMRFEREAQAIAQLEHPHIVRLYRYGEANGLLYMAMQFVEGAALNQVLTSYRADGEYIEPDEAARIAAEVGLALDYAHGKGVIHRDIKPSNIILDKQGRAILADFGLALLTEVGTQGQIFGTPHYIAPEQAISSAKAVPQSDLYSVGVILYEMFTGELPFDAAQPLDVAMLHMTAAPPAPREVRPELSPTLEAVLLKTLAKEAKDRYPSGAALAQALTQALRTNPADAPTPLASSRQTGLTIPERVAVSLARRPLPPVPAMISDPPPPPVETQPVSSTPELRLISTRDSEPQPQAIPAPAGVTLPDPPPPPKLRWPIILGVGIGLVIVIGLLLITLLGYLWLRGRSTATAGQPSPEATTPAAVETALIAGTSAETGGDIPATTAPAETTAPVDTPVPLLPTDAPLAEPLLVADSSRDFSGSSGAWGYLSSPPDENNFKPMKFEERQYGACWYDQDYIRICQASGHPGNSADVAWLWISPTAGHVRVLVSTHKIDRGGDGVSILAYHNSMSQPVEGLALQGNDTSGVNQKIWFETDVAIGDSLIFVLKKNRSAENDHTAFQVQIYQQ